jgi:hypothetical protein
MRTTVSNCVEPAQDQNLKPSMSLVGGTSISSIRRGGVGGGSTLLVLILPNVQRVVIKLKHVGRQIHNSAYKGHTESVDIMQLYLRVHLKCGH